MAASAEAIAHWRAEPERFVRDVFGAVPDLWQARALRSLGGVEPPRRRLALQACAGPGKSAVLAWAGWHTLATRGGPDEHPTGYAISCTADNLRDNLWKELAYWYNRSPLLQAAFEWSAEAIRARSAPATWWLRARSYPRSADAEAVGRTLSGLHGRHMVYLLDEAGDMPPQLLRTAEQGLGNCTWGAICLAGNPTSREGALYTAATHQSERWQVVRITGDPDDPERSSRIDLAWATEQCRTYGRQNPWVQAYVLGEFPEGTLNTLLGPDDVYGALGRSYTAATTSMHQKRLGIDVARFGDDRTVIFPRQGLQAYPPVVLRSARTTDIAARVATEKSRWGSELELIDDTGGWAAGVIDQALLAHLPLVPVNASSTPTDPRYYNRRSELHFLAAEWVKRGGALPEGLTEIVREATAARYWFEGGKLRVEAKDQIKRRIGVSPDLWDALMLTFALPEQANALDAMPGMPVGRSALGVEYDPFAALVTI